MKSKNVACITNIVLLFCFIMCVMVFLYNFEKEQCENVGGNYVYQIIGGNKCIYNFGKGDN